MIDDERAGPVAPSILQRDCVVSHSRPFDRANVLDEKSKDYLLSRNQSCWRILANDVRIESWQGLHFGDGSIRIRRDAINNVIQGPRNKPAIVTLLFGADNNSAWLRPITWGQPNESSFIYMSKHAIP